MASNHQINIQRQPLHKPGYQTFKSKDNSHILWRNNNGLCVICLTRPAEKINFFLSPKDKIQPQKPICKIYFPDGSEELFTLPFSHPSVIYDLNRRDLQQSQPSTNDDQTSSVASLDSKEFFIVVMPSKQETLSAYEEQL